MPRGSLPTVMAAVVLLAACGGGESATSAPATTAPTTVPAATSEPAASRTFTGADGTTSEIADTGRIVTLSGDLTEMVYALGFGASVVAVDVTTVYPPDAAELPIVGVGRFLTAEGVLAEEPTLVLGDTQTSPTSAIDQIRAAGVPVVILDVPVTFEGLYDKIGAVAEVLGVPEEGAALAASVRADIETALAAAEPFAERPAVAFVYSRGPDVMLLFGAEMTTQPLIEAAGGIDVGTALGIDGTLPVSAEALVAAAPDVIVITSEGLEALGGVAGLLEMPGFAETPAGRAGRILDYPEGDILTFGPRVAESLELLIADLRASVG